MDMDNNKYTKKVTVPFLVKEKPLINVVEVKGDGKAGATIDLEVYLKNAGSEDAEAVDARLIKQSSQPFSLDLRSNYVGELKVGETAKAIFKVKINKDAEFKEHFLKMLIRAKGDSDKGDENIYIFNIRAAIKVEGKAPNRYITAGFIAVAAVIGVLGLKFLRRKSKKDKNGK